MTAQIWTCNGTYRRDRTGTWRYPWGASVPGAVDLLLADLLMIDPTLALYDIIEDFRQLTPAEIRWLAGCKPDLDQMAVRRRGNQASHAGDLVVAMQAPELHLIAMMTVGDIAETCDVSKATIDSYRYRGYLPEPQMIIGRTPVWSRPVVNRWIESRPGCGWRTDVYTRTSADSAPAHRHRAAQGA